MKNLILLSAAALAASFVIFGRSCFGGHFVLDPSPGTDVYHLSVLFERLGAHLAAGHYPVYFPEFGGGYPVAAAWMYGLYYPPTLLLAVLPPDLGWTASATLHLLLASIGMYLFLRRSLESAAGAATGALIYAFSEYMVGRATCGHLNLVWPAAWAPWVLLAARRAVHGDRGGVPLLASTLGIGLISGHLQSWFYLAPLVAVYAHLQVGSRPRLPALGRFLAGVALALGIAAVQWTSTVELVSISGRPDLTETPLEDFGAPLRILAAKVFPGFFGHMGDGQWGWTGAPHEVFAIGGLAVLMLAFIGLAARGRGRWFWGGTVVLGLLLAPGVNFAVSAWLNDLPVLSWGRSAGRALHLAVLGVSVLAGRGAAAWLDRERPISRRRLVAAGTMSASLAILVLAGLLLWMRRALPAAESSARFAETWLPSVLRSVAGVTAATAALFVVRRWRRTAPVLPLVMLVVVIATALPPVRTVSSEFYFHDWSKDLPADAIAHGIYVKHERFPYLERQGYRVHRPMSHVDAPWYLDVLYSRSENALRWIDLRYSVSGIRQGDLYAGPPYPKPKVLTERPACGRFQWFPTARAGVIAEDARRILGSGTWTLLLADQVPVDPSPTDRRPPREIVMSEQPPPGEIAIRISAPADGWLYLSDKYYPFWKATMDGRTVTVHRANVAGMAVRVPAGEHRIELRFAPLSAKVGPWVSLGSLLFCLALLVFRRKP